VPSRPSDNYLQDGASPFLYPGLNVRENAVKDYAEDLASETEASVKASNYTLAVADKATEGRQTPPAGRQTPPAVTPKKGGRGGWQHRRLCDPFAPALPPPRRCRIGSGLNR
jgi:hypothetical protein